MWPFVNAAPQPSAAPRPLSRRSDRASRARATVSAQDVANDFVENAGTVTYTPDDGTRRAAQPQHPRGGSTERSSCSTRSFRSRCGDADAPLPQLTRYSIPSLRQMLQHTEECLQETQEDIQRTLDYLIDAPSAGASFDRLMRQLQMLKQRLRKYEAKRTTLKADLGVSPPAPAPDKTPGHDDPIVGRLADGDGGDDTSATKDDASALENKNHVPDEPTRPASNGRDPTPDQSFQRDFDTTEGDVLGGTEEDVLGGTSSQKDDDSKSHSPTEVEGDKDIKGTAFERVAPPADGTTSHSHPEVEGDADITGTAVDQAATTDGTVLTSYSMVEGDTKCGGADVHYVPQEDNKPDDDVQGLELSASDLYDDAADFPRRTASTASADAEFTVSNVVPIGADAEVARQDDVLPPNATTSTDSPPSGGRGSFKSILTKSGLDHKPGSLIQATAAAPPRQTTSPSCAPSLMAPANNITTPMTSGQGKGAPAKAPPRQSNGRSSGRSKHNKKKGKHAVPAIALPHQPQRRSSQQSALAPTAILPRSHVVATDGPRPPSHRQLWSPATLTNQSSIKGGAQANRTTSANGDGQAMLELKQQVTRLLLTNSRLRQENSRLTSELADTRMAVQVSPHNREDAAANDDDDATVATSNLTDADVCETVPDWDDDGDEDVTDVRVDDAIDGGAPVHRSLHQGSPSNIQSVHAAPSITFELVSTGTEDIRLIETNNQRKPQDVEGLPLEPKRKRRRRRKRKRPRRRKGKANKRRPGHSPVTPPRRQDNARRQAAKTHESFIKEFRAFMYSNAAKYCPASGFDTNWHRKGIG